MAKAAAVFSVHWCTLHRLSIDHSRLSLSAWYSRRAYFRARTRTPRVPQSLLWNPTLETL
eukprot:2827773-Rhodomonas_salina.1